MKTQMAWSGLQCGGLTYECSSDFEQGVGVNAEFREFLSRCGRWPPLLLACRSVVAAAVWRLARCIAIMMRPDRCSRSQDTTGRQDRTAAAARFLFLRRALAGWMCTLNAGSATLLLLTLNLLAVQGTCVWAQGLYSVAWILVFFSLKMMYGWSRPE